MPPRVKIIFLCTGNSCRSQIAEGWAKALRGHEIEAYSAGTSPHGLNPLAVRCMAEVGVDISGHQSKHIDSLRSVAPDYVITVCDAAHESCPYFPGPATIVHHGFDDPPRLAKNAASEEEALSHYRRVRDEIREYVQSLPQSLPPSRVRPLSQRNEP